MRPWETDEELTNERVREIATICDSRFGEVEITKFRGGWDFQTFQVGDHIFRFPKRAPVVEALQNEWVVLDLLSSYDAPVALPDHQIRIDDASLFRWPFCAYKLCPGTPIVDRVEPPSTLEDAIGFLVWLHGITPTWEPGPVEPFDEWIEASIERIASIESLIGLSAASRFRTQLRGQPPLAVVGTLVHGDLGPDHLLVDSEGRLRAVIDWADSMNGDRAIDYAGLATVWSFDDVRRTAKIKDDLFWDRVRFYATLAGISMAWFGVCEQRKEYQDWGVKTLRAL